MRVIGAKNGVKTAKILEKSGGNPGKQGEKRALYWKKWGDFGGCSISFAYSFRQD